ncbi:Crp/Fnr family transcriptional regulator [Desulfobulbus oralis]|uniref:Crp/Fnr family transcriptional regulator n=1 Tax=Desulfobulbus oralis TaxID=1986146 RepID=A0A2L1GMY1_9BACT|nr:Crp/Fnr family transcriptional regulator [Desulfobulbus oralis]AVD71008.1 Crp/Fnr family transcriptional regulator [Desulfobulbus oralis]
MQNFWHLEKENFFAGLENEKRQFLTLSRRQELEKNKTVFIEGDAGISCFYIESGLIRIFSEVPSGKESTLFLRQGGEIFGLAEVMNRTPRVVSAQALCRSIIHTIEQPDFERLLEGNFSLVRRVISILGRRLRYMGKRLSSQNGDVAHRLAFLLITLAYENLKKTSNWEVPCLLPHTISQNQLADMISSTQPTISLALHEFRTSGLIAVSGRRITLLKPMALILKFIED